MIPLSFNHHSIDQRSGLFVGIPPISYVSRDYLTLTGANGGMCEMELRHKVVKLKNLDSSIEALVKSLNCQDWQASVFLDDHYPYYALVAVRRGHLSKIQFATLMLRWAAVQRHGSPDRIQTVPMFLTDGKLNPVAAQQINATFEVMVDPEISAQFFLAMKQLPKSEQQFFLCPHDPYFEEGVEIAFNETVAWALLNVSKFNIFHIVDQSSGLQMVPSCGMMQEFLNVSFGFNAVQINPVIGVSSFQDIRKNGLNGTRDMGISFPGYLFKKADGWFAPYYQWTKHDFYHVWIASHASLLHRRLFVQIGDRVEQNARLLNPGTQRKALLLFRRFLVDMDLTPYRVHTNSRIAFWETIVLFLKLTRQPLLVSDDLVTSMIHEIESSCPSLFKSLSTTFSEIDQRDLSVAQDLFSRIQRVRLCQPLFKSKL